MRGGVDVSDTVRCSECGLSTDETVFKMAVWKDVEMALCSQCIAKLGFGLEGHYFRDIVLAIAGQSENATPVSQQKGKIPDSLRRQVIERDGFRCRYCGETVNRPQLDHVTPESRGGPTSLNNLVVSCKRCNSAKGPRTPDEAGMALLPIDPPEG